MQLSLFGAWATCVLASAVWLCRRELDTLLLDDGPGAYAARWCFLPDPKLQRQRDHERTHAAAWHTLRVAAVWLCVLLGVGHIYAAQYDANVAARDAARLQQPPYHCGPGSPEWNDLGVWSKLGHTFYPTSAEQSCSEWLARVQASVWPNPFPVLADLVGQFVAHLFAHVSWLIGVLLVACLPACCVAMLAAWPWIRALHFLAPSKSPDVVYPLLEAAQMPPLYAAATTNPQCTLELLPATADDFVGL